MTDALSIQVGLWNIETCWSHLKKGNEVGGWEAETNQGIIHVQMEMSQ
jgi:hypothetical protein